MTSANKPDQRQTAIRNDTTSSPPSHTVVTSHFHFASSVTPAKQESKQDPKKEPKPQPVLHHFSNSNSQPNLHSNDNDNDNDNKNNSNSNSNSNNNSPINAITTTTTTNNPVASTHIITTSDPSTSLNRITPRKRSAAAMLGFGKADKRSTTGQRASPRPASSIPNSIRMPQHSNRMASPRMQPHLDNPHPPPQLNGLGEHINAESLHVHDTHSQSMPLRVPPPPSHQEEEISTANRLCQVTIEPPSSPGGYKRMRSSADSDAGSSSCKDIDETEVLAPDSVPALITQLRQLIDYVQSKPTLQHGSASFMRDYLRTMLIQDSIAAEEAIQTASKNQRLDVSVTGRRKTDECFQQIPDELAKHILSFLDGHNLAKAREVCRRWDEFACDEQLWKALCVKDWRSLQTDEAAWKLIDSNVDLNAPNKWRLIYPKVNKTPKWKCRLQKTGRFICNLVAHQISGTPLMDSGLPNVLVVERRFNIMHLNTFVLPEASVLYFEPEKESDRAGFDDFIQYLDKRTRAGLALEEQRRFIFIPPCDYTRNIVHYEGNSLLGVVQNAYPPLAP